MTTDLREFGEFNGVLIRSRELGDQDVAVIREVLIEDTYALRLRRSYRPNEVVFDIGAHIGTFAIAWHRMNPTARIICIEACPENIAILKANVGKFATVIHAACTYEPGELALVNSIMSDGRGKATGGSMVVPRDSIDHRSDAEHWHDKRPLRKVTIEEVVAELGLDGVDVLKMDCEFSEFSIVENSPTIDSIKFICGEYHDKRRWIELANRRFRGWHYGHMGGTGALGTFHLEHPDYWSLPKPCYGIESSPST